MQPHDGGLAGEIVDRDDVEPAWAFRNAAFRQKVLRGASQEMLFARRDAELRQGGHFFTDSARSNFDEGKCFAIVADHVDFPF